MVILVWHIHPNGPMRGLRLPKWITCHKKCFFPIGFLKHCHLTYISHNLSMCFLLYSYTLFVRHTKSHNLLITLKNIRRPNHINVVRLDIGFHVLHSIQLWQIPLSFIHHNLVIVHVATLALGSRPRKGLTKVRAKNEARESYFMLLGM
jgi:hypothetical protein